MDWFKRHWVDALMVALIVTVVGGVVTLLLRGSGFGVSPPSVTAMQPLRPAAQQTAPPVTPSSSPAAPSNPVAPPTPAPSSQPAPPAAPSPAKPVEVAAIPPLTSASSSNPVSSSAPTIELGIRPSAASPTSASVNRPQPATAQREPLNYARADFLRNYRVAIATYSSATRAQTSAARLRSLGYPAQAFSSGNGFIVVAGPYAREISARKAFNKLRTQGYSDAVLYSPNGNRERSAAAKSVVIPTPKPVPSGGDSRPVQLDPGLSYLQVGAFKNTQSALPLLERLRGSGFKTLLRSASDGYTRVLVGPFSAALLGNAKQNLSGQGLTPFAVKQ